MAPTASLFTNRQLGRHEQKPSQLSSAADSTPPLTSTTVAPTLAPGLAGSSSMLRVVTCGSGLQGKSGQAKKAAATPQNQGTWCTGAWSRRRRRHREHLHPLAWYRGLREGVPVVSPRSCAAPSARRAVNRAPGTAVPAPCVANAAADIRHARSAAWRSIGVRCKLGRVQQGFRSWGLCAKGRCKLLRCWLS